MKILFIHNNYASDNTGEEHAAEALVNLLSEKEHTVEWYRRSSAELDKMSLGKLRAVLLSIYNPAASRAIRNIIREQQPELVQVQNLYPLISPRILKTIKSAGLPVVMRCPNYRVFCPTGLFYDTAGNICERCTGKGHETWCIRKNCTGSIGKSIGYAFRNFVARITGVFHKYVDIFIVQSEFQKGKFIELGIPENKIEILPGITPEVKVYPSGSAASYITFVGRISHEKGIDDFLEAAQRLPDLKFAVAGEVPEDFSPVCQPENVTWFGFLKGKDLDELYGKSEIIIVPSRWYEGFPNVVTRAMAHSVPVITTNIGVFPGIVGNDCGLTYPPGDIDALTDRIRQLDGDRGMLERMGVAGLNRSLRDYSREAIYIKLMQIYKTVLPSTDVPAAL